MAPSVGTHGRSFPISTSTEILKKLKKKGRLLAAEKAVTKKAFWVNGPLQLLSSLLLSLRPQTGLQVQVASVPVQQFPSEDWPEALTAQAMERAGTATEWP